MSKQALTFKAQSTNELGQSLTDASQLDNHYRLCKAEYDRAIASVGIQSGWHVLDAGSGNGVFLPQIASLLGNSGRVVAVDHSAENVATVERWVKAAQCEELVESRLADVRSLPLETDSFDCVWCANVSQYLTDDELRQAIAEFVRVAKPGGLVAIKEFDASLWQWFPVDMRLVWRLVDAAALAGVTQVVGCLRSWNMSKWMRDQGLEIISRRGYVSEIQQLLPSDVPHYAGVFRWFASIAKDLTLSEADKGEWQRLSDDVESVLTDPDYLYREMFTLTIGLVNAK